MFANFKYSYLSTIKSQSSFKSMEMLPSIPVTIDGNGINAKFRITVTIPDYTPTTIPSPGSAKYNDLCDTFSVTFVY